MCIEIVFLFLFVLCFVYFFGATSSEAVNYICTIKQSVVKIETVHLQ